MKNIHYLILFTLFLLGVMAPGESKAQGGEKVYGSVNWQINLPLGNSFADVGSGWGAHADVGYPVTENLGLGVFFSFHTNNKYIDRQTLSLGETGSMTTDQQHSIYQVPFGASVRYFIPTEGFLVKPFLNANIGANYSNVSSDINVFRVYEKEWGFYISPEIGINMFLNPEKSLGLRLSTYYSYATNKSEVFEYTVNGLHNWGLRIGLAF